MRPILAALIALPLLAIAQESTVKAPPLAEAKAKAVQGLTFTVTAGGKTDTRAARLVSLHVPKGQPITPFVPAGAFTAKWEGDIVSPLRAEYTIGADVQGALKVTLNGTLILEGAGDGTVQTVNKPVQLSKGPNKLLVEFASDGTTDATLQLKWWSKEFPAEPIPPTVFSHDESASALREGSRIREGRLLFAQLRCSACHADPALIPPRGEGMPELAQDAPVFDELGAKYNEAWLAQWINDPHAIRPHALMPRVFASKPGEVDQRAADLAAYLVTLGKRDDTAPAADNAPLGGALFANFGCIACHTTPDFNGADENGRTPLSHVKAKWQPRALREFLKNPAKNYAWTHMPNFRLTDDEAERLTAFLIAGEQRDFPAGPKGDAARGAQLLATSGCLNCHAGMPPTTQPPLAATLKSGWTKGCLAPDATARGNAPDFALTEPQREALLAFAATGFGSLKQDSPVEFAERQIKNMRCTACHSRDGEPSTWTAVEGDMAPLQAAAPTQPEGEGAPIAGTAAPVLTWTGEKLQPKWAAEFIAGHVAYKPRPWLIARMPGFETVAKGIADGLSLEHGFALEGEIAPLSIEKERSESGEKLLGENGGFNCTTCHGVGERAPTAVFEAPGINLAYAAERLRKGYYHRWVLHPLRIDPETKMPRFADDEGKTPLTDFYNGEAREQFEAIWQYLHTTQKPAPEK